jgi:adenosylhomocysteine nucleosidase
MKAEKVLVCFAVEEEAAPFRKRLGKSEVEILITGMGERNAEREIEAALQKGKPRMVLTCGFAGGLRPGITMGTVLYDAADRKEIEPRLDAAGAIKARFCFSERVAATAAEKRGLWESSRADAVEMESHAIRAKCREKGIPSAIVRVVLDAAEEDLPLDFNRLMTADKRMNYGKLALELARAPGKIGALVRLQQQTRAAAEKLADVLEKFVRAEGNRQEDQQTGT